MKDLKGRITFYYIHCSSQERLSPWSSNNFMRMEEKKWLRVVLDSLEVEVEAWTNRCEEMACWTMFLHHLGD